MARLQILELPTEHHGDDTVTPWILVIDQVPTGEAAFDAIRRDLLADGDLAPRLGARAVLVFEETIDIPTNEVTAQAEPLSRVGEFVGCDEVRRLIEERDELHAEIGLAQGQLHSTALSAIRGKHATIRELTERAEQAEAERTEARNWARYGYEIGQRHCGWTDHGVAPDWLTEGWPNSFDSCEHLQLAAQYDEALSRVHAESAAIRATTRTWEPVADRIDAALNGTREGDDETSTGRPTHPDGRPYNYSEIAAEGWGHCDGCRTWGQWTADKPHNCPAPIAAHAADA